VNEQLSYLATVLLDIEYPLLTEQKASRAVCTAGLDTLEKRKSLALPGSK